MLLLTFSITGFGKQKIISLGIATILFSSLTSCSLINYGTIGREDSPVKIEKISEKKRGKKVYISGEVTKIVPFLDSAAYQIKDSTGSIWVMTNSLPLPSLGQTILIKGKIQYLDIESSDKEFKELHIVELKQFDRSATLLNIKKSQHLFSQN